MNKQQQIMEKMLALLLLVYAIGLLLGEGLRDHLYGELIQQQEVVPEQERIPGSPFPEKRQEVEALLGSVHLAQAEMVAFGQRVEEDFLRCFVVFFDHGSVSCPNSCLNLRIHY